MRTKIFKRKKKKANMFACLRSMYTAVRKTLSSIFLQPGSYFHRCSRVNYQIICWDSTNAVRSVEPDGSVRQQHETDMVRCSHRSPILTLLSLETESECTWNVCYDPPLHRICNINNKPMEQNFFTLLNKSDVYSYASNAKKEKN